MPNYKTKEEKPKETISIEVPNTSTNYNDNYYLLNLLLGTTFIVKKKFN